MATWMSYCQLLVLLVIVNPSFLSVISQVISPSGTVTIAEGNSLPFTCTRRGSTSAQITVQLDGATAPSNLLVIISISNGATVAFGPVNRNHNGKRLRCKFSSPTNYTRTISLNVVYPPTVFPKVTNGSVTEGVIYSTSLTITGKPFPTRSIMKDGYTIQDGRITANTGSGFTISDVVCSDGGSYRVNVVNSVGSDAAVINIDVLCSDGKMITPSGQVTLAEGETLSFNCTSEAMTSSDIILELNSRAVLASENLVAVTTIDNGAAITFGPVRRSHNSGRLRCNFFLFPRSPYTAEIRLNVTFPPSITPNITNETAIEGTSFTTPLTITGNPFPVSSNIVITKDGVTVQDGRITVNIGSGNGASSFTIQNVTRTDSESYTVNVTTTAGSDTAVVNLDVYFLPHFKNLPPEVQAINQFSTFKFNCSPSKNGYPMPRSYVFQLNGLPIIEGGNVDITEGVSGSILTVSSLNRSEDSGNYTCMVTNEAGSVTIATYLNVSAPPTVPQLVMSSEVGPFSATISWSPPSDYGGTVQPLKYSINITNNTVTLSFTTSDVTTLLQYLQHSTLYIVTVVAENDLGLGPSPPAVINFTTPDSVPIIESESVEALSLTILSVDIVLLTDGGQNVTSYTVLVTSVNYTNENIIPLAELTSHNLTVDNLTKGEYYTVNVTATNSVGISETFQSSFTVPFPPNFTSPSTPLDLSAIPPNTCCAGIQLGLQNPNNPVEIQVQVSTGGGDFSEARFTRSVTDMDIIYVEGLVAGTEYTIRVTVSNILGMEKRIIIATSLIGYPSKPSRPAVTVAGSSVTVSVGVPYPGTRGDVTVSVWYQRVSAKRQSDRVEMNLTLSNSVAGPVMGEVTFEGLPVGDFIVTAIARNEFGESELSERSEAFQVTEVIPPMTVVIGSIAGGSLFGILLIIIVILIFVRCFKKRSKTGDRTQKEVMYEDLQLKEVNLQLNPSYATVDVPSHPTSSITGQTEDDKVIYN